MSKSISVEMSAEAWRDVLNVLIETVQQGWSRYDDESNGVHLFVQAIGSVIQKEPA
jgi:hypothetical protein